jgi:hypothetical protein
LREELDGSFPYEKNMMRVLDWKICLQPAEFHGMFDLRGRDQFNGLLYGAPD